MRHRVQSKTLRLKRAPRRALVRNLITSLILHESIQTTELRAKILQRSIEKLITLVKRKNQREAIRTLQKFLFHEEASRKMLSEILTRFQKKTSGYTRIIPVKVRPGDAASIVQIEFTF
ncbi:50S ribosomal protein L17 [Candidatus Peregrinibacteria bacterium]|nr:50S ribosomal protein L17 [Candidatus Peregrinibacteria bacterium]